VPPKLINIAGIGSITATILSQHKFKTVASIAHAEVEELSAVPGFSAARAEKTINAAKQLLDSTISNLDTDASISKASSEAENKKAKQEKKNKTRGKKKKDKIKGKDKKKNKKKSDKNKSKDKKKNKKGK
jgi:hypothetical protein